MKSILHLPLTLNKCLVCFLIVFFGLNFSSYHSFAKQSVKDSLYFELSNARSLKAKFSAHFSLANLDWGVEVDTVLYHLDKAEKFAKDDNNVEGLIEVANNRAVLYNDLSEYDKALEILNAALELTDANTKASLMGRLLGNIGNVYSYKNHFSKAIEYYSKSIVFFEEDNNEIGLANLHGTLGNLKYKNLNYYDAIESYNNSRLLFIKLGVKGGEAVTEMNIGNCYKKLQILDSAYVYYNRALEKYDALGNMPYYKAQCLANIGNLYSQQKDYSKAAKYLLEAETSFLQIKNTYSIAQVNLDLAEVYFKNGRTEEALKRINAGKKIVEENDFYYLRLLVNRLLWEYHKDLKDYENAHYWLMEYMTVNDSLERIDRKENVDLLLAQFETERKEREIEILKKNDEINQLKIRRRTLNLYIVIVGLTIALAFIVSLYINIKKVKGMNNLLALQNTEIAQQKEEITSQRDEIESQRDLLQTQNEKLEQFRTHTNQSLRYAQSIQASILPPEKILESISNDFFVFIKPCELVSGDFFWATTFDDFRVFCVADCTGHGVPGAFMSILGVSALNDIVSRHRVTKPSEILGYLRESVIEALSQNDPEQLHKDGMDIALCVYNMKNRELQFAGAGLPLWIVSRDLSKSSIGTVSASTIVENGYSLYEVKGDIMPVGLSPKKEDFKNHSFALGDSSVRVYLSTDGYIDQLGGTEGKKFQKQNLLNLILGSQSSNMQNQKKIVDSNFENWKNKYSQIDDVTILGLEL